ncbi:MbtH family NRPS accessory protein [Streptomyces sp. JH002]|uniref:MbtH family protein n=1 Tax=Streptomyces sp. JH002 TaxID=2763259 RepID=UPI003D804584
MPETAESTARFVVVRNDEEQYSIFPENRPLPAGWYEEGFAGERQPCLDHIAEVWTDMRPKSLRDAMDGAAGQPAG